MYKSKEYDYVLHSKRILRIAASGIFDPQTREIDHLSIEFVEECIDNEIEMELMEIENDAAERLADA